MEKGGDGVHDKYRDCRSMLSALVKDWIRIINDIQLSLTLKYMDRILGYH